jgi:hypothetical protein
MAANTPAPAACPAVQDALTVARRLAIRNPERIQHLHLVQPQQLAGRGSGAEHTHGGGPVPAPINCGRHRHAAGNVETQCNRQQQVPPGNLSDTVRHGQRRGEHRNTGMDRPSPVQRIVVIQRMTHRGIHQRRVMRGQADPVEKHPALLPPAPRLQHAHQFRDPRRTAATQHAAERVGDVVAGSLDRGRRKIFKPRPADMLRQIAGRIADGHGAQLPQRPVNRGCRFSL